jgi:hypothetical protein
VIGGCGRLVLHQGGAIAEGVDLEGVDVKVGEVGAAEAGGDGYVGGVAAGGHEDATGTRVVVTGVHVPPAAVDPDLVPGAEVAGAGVGDADVADVAGDVAGGNLHAAGERDGEVLEVAADADALGEDVHGGHGGASLVVVEGDFFVDPVADGGGEGPAGAEVAEEVVGDRAEEVDFAVAAGEEELEGFAGEELDWNLGEVESLELREAVDVDDIAAVEAEVAGGGEEAGAEVAEGVEVFVDWDVVEGLVVGAELFGVEAVVGVDAGDVGELDGVLGMEVQQRHDGCGVGEVELNVVLGLDEHRVLSGEQRSVGRTNANERRGLERGTRVLKVRCGEGAVGCSDGTLSGRLRS